MKSIGAFTVSTLMAIIGVHYLIGGLWSLHCDQVAMKYDIARGYTDNLGEYWSGDDYAYIGVGTFLILMSLITSLCFARNT